MRTYSAKLRLSFFWWRKGNNLWSELWYRGSNSSRDLTSIFATGWEYLSAKECVTEVVLSLAEDTKDQRKREVRNRVERPYQGSMARTKRDRAFQEWIWRLNWVTRRYILSLSLSRASHRRHNVLLQTNSASATRLFRDTHIVMKTSSLRTGSFG